MNRLGNQLFAGTALACDQDGGIGGSHTSHRVQYLHQGFGASYDVTEIEALIHLGAVQRLIGFSFLFAQGQGCSNRLKQHQVVPRLRNEIKRTALHPFHR